MSDTLTFRGYVPKPWQRPVHNAIRLAGPKAGKIFVVKSPRQIGKSLIVEMELLRHAINYSNSVSICVSITFSNCKKIYKELHDGIVDSGLIKKADNQAMEITLINGSQIIFKSAQQRESLRGYTIKNGGILCIDEAAYITDEVFATVFPWTNVNHANILMVSTPRIKQGTFYDYFIEGLDGSELIQSFDLSKYDTSEMLSPDKIELYRKKMPRAQFITEILGEFSESGAGVFDLTKRIWLDHDILSPSDMFIGIDWGTGANNDYTVVSGFNPAGDQVLLKMTNSSSPMDQVDWIASIIMKYDKKKVRKIVCEKNSIGSVYIDALRRKLQGYQIEEFTTSNTTKREIIEYLIERVENETVKFMKDKEQYVQLGAYAMEITSSGMITYNGLPGTHDDCVMAAAMAFKAIKDLETNGNYTFGFTSNRQKIDRLRDKWK